MLGRSTRCNIPPGLSEAAERARKEFLELFETYLGESKSVPMTILVGGPSTTRLGLVAQKRCELRDRLINEGFFAAFSEDLPSPRKNISEATKEVCAGQGS